VKKLKILAKHEVGIDNIDVKSADSLFIIVANAHSSNGEEVANLVLELLYFCVCRIYQIITADGYSYKSSRLLPFFNLPNVMLNA